MRQTAAIILLVLLVGAGFTGVRWWTGGQLERSQEEAITAATTRYDVDPALIKAVVWRESRFRAEARGKSGELGLMQLQEIAAQEWADAERVSGFKHEHCLDAHTNTLAGTFYLRKLLRRYRHTDDPVPYALADYNAGRSRVLNWLEGSGSTNSAVFIQHISFPATQEYVVQVMKRSQQYRQ